MGDFERIFGGLDDRSEAGYGITQFFLNGGSDAYVLRVAKDDPVNSLPLKIATVIVKNGGADIIRISARNAGAWGNTLRAEIDYNTLDPTSLFNIKITRSRPFPTVFFSLSFRQ